jgi:DNA-binding NarL/FixJ family response regulator
MTTEPDSGQGYLPCRGAPAPPPDGDGVVLLRSPRAVPLPIEALGLKEDPPLQVVECWPGAAEPALTRSEAGGYAIALIERRVLGANGFAWLGRWRRAHPGLRVLLLWEPGEPITEVVTLGLLRADISGVIPADVPVALYRKAIQTVRDGEVWLPRAAMEAALALVVGRSSTPGVDDAPPPPRGAPVGLPRLTPRESEVLGLLRQGLSNKEIARHLGISPETVKKCLACIYHKAGVNSRTQLLYQLSP